MRQYYDALFQDLEGTRRYAEFVRNHATGSSLLEFASGTGDLLALLSDSYSVRGIDLDTSMLEKAVVKYPQLENALSQGNFLEYNDAKKYDTLVCVGDSLNYLDDTHELMRFVENAQALSDTILLDMHHTNRLVEFQEPYVEEGSTDTFDYMYTIDVDGEHLYHTINFLDGTFDQVVQWVFDANILVKAFEKYGYTVTVYYDFDLIEANDEVEKVMLVCKKNR